jgi:hypothetical protein
MTGLDRDDPPSSTSPPGSGEPPPEPLKTLNFGFHEPELWLP